VDILQHPPSITYLRGRQRMNGVVKICHGRSAHRLLMSHGGNHEIARSLQSQRERRILRLLAVRFPIDTVA
jgi:hypothetical protein